jgi:hypothetical protein
LFKDLQKLVSYSEQQEQKQKQSLLIDRLHNKPFWIWDIAGHKREDILAHGDCCFNRIKFLMSDSKEVPAANISEHYWI